MFSNSWFSGGTLWKEKEMEEERKPTFLNVPYYHVINYDVYVYEQSLAACMHILE